MAKRENQVVAKELRGQAEAELRSLLATKVEQLHKAKLKKAIGQLRTTHELKLLKRDIAVLSTVINERALAGSAQ